jgi:hypothetical protein
MRNIGTERMGRVGQRSSTLTGKIIRIFLKIPSREVTFARRGFRGGGPGVWRRLEWIGECFLHGYHASLEVETPEHLPPRLDTLDHEYVGFAYEGAAMGLTLLDHLLPRSRPRLAAFLDGPGDPHAYMIHVGAGWAIARLRLRIDPAIGRLDPLLRWLAVDGIGFHEGYFHWRRSVRGGRVPARLVDYGRRAFDQGLGRSLWFVDGADVELIRGTIRAFDRARWADLWSGVGLAATYAGGAGPDALAVLRTAAGPYLPALAQGASFAARVRQRAGTPAAHTDRACRILCGLGADEAAAVSDAALQDLPKSGAFPAYEAWRRRVQCRFA